MRQGVVLLSGYNKTEIMSVERGQKLYHA